MKWALPSILYLLSSFGEAYSPSAFAFSSGAKNGASRGPSVPRFHYFHMNWFFCLEGPCPGSCHSLFLLCLVLPLRASLVPPLSFTCSDLCVLVAVRRVFRRFEARLRCFLGTMMPLTPHLVRQNKASLSFNFFSGPFLI